MMALGAGQELKRTPEMTQDVRVVQLGKGWASGCSGSPVVGIDPWVNCTGIGAGGAGNDALAFASRRLKSLALHLCFCILRNARAGVSSSNLARFNLLAPSSGDGRGFLGVTVTSLPSKM